MRLTLIGSSLLLVLSAANAFAEPGGQRRDAVRAYQAQHITLERNERRNEQPVQPQPDLPRSRGFGLPDTSGYGALENWSNPSFDGPSKQGRLTPEARRALRRQIGEVGHDIYTPER